MRRPIDRVEINDMQHVITGDQFAMDGIDHDVTAGTLTLTFVNVETLRVVYKDMLHREEP